MVVLAVFGADRAARAEVEAEQVREAIRRGTQFLLREQQPGGSWRRYQQHDLTGLCTLALLQAGVKPDDPAIQKARAIGDHLLNGADLPFAWSAGERTSAPGTAR